MRSLWLNDQVGGERDKHPVIGAFPAPTRCTTFYNAGTQERRGLKKEEGKVIAERRLG